MIKLMLATTVLIAVQTAGAQTIWRCGNSYSATPCAGASAVQAQEPRPADDVQAARQVAERERQWADQLRAEREQREASSAGGPAGIRDHRQAKANQNPLRKTQAQKKKRSPEEPGTWRAVAPSSRHTKG